MTSYSLICTAGRVAALSSGSATDIEFVAVPRGGGQGKPCVISIHADSDTSSMYWNQTSRANNFTMLDRIVRAGLVVVSADLDNDFGNSGWGNPSVQARVKACRDLAATYGAHPTRYSLIGFSMGSTSSMICAANDPTNVAAMVLGMPLPDFEAVRSAAGYTAQIDTAWAITPTTLTTPNIQQGGVDVTPMNATRQAAIAAIPKKVYYSPGDVQVTSMMSSLTSWAAAVGATLESEGSALHGDTQVADYPKTEICDFLAAAV